MINCKAEVLPHVGVSMRVSPNVDHLFLDFGNVCAALDGTSFKEGFIARTNVTMAALDAALYGPIHGYSQLFADYECGKVSTTQFFHRLCATLGCAGKIDFDEFAKLFVNVFTPNHELETLLLHLKPGKRVYLLSNTNVLVHARIISYASLILRHISCRFDRIVSYGVGVLKPHPDIYLAAFARANARPESCLFVDDLKANIDAWCTLGGHGIVYNVNCQPISFLEQSFEEYGLLA